MKNLNEQHHEQLENFNQSLDNQMLWQTDSDRKRVAEAKVRAIYEFEQGLEASFEIMARRYYNLGDTALKVCFWDLASHKRSYLGVIGYHSLDASPYCRLAQPAYNEAQLYTILESITTDTSTADYHWAQPDLAVAI